jgi:hypothetical protein
MLGFIHRSITSKLDEHRTTKKYDQGRVSHPILFPFIAFVFSRYNLCYKQQPTSCIYTLADPTLLADSYMTKTVGTVADVCIASRLADFGHLATPKLLNIFPGKLPWTMRFRVSIEMRCGIMFLLV